MAQEKTESLIENEVTEETTIVDENETAGTEGTASIEVAEESEEVTDQPETRPVRQSDSRYMNNVSLTGTIVKLVSNKTVTVVTLCTKATMTVSNYPTVYFFGGSSTKAAEFKEGDRVNIKGMLQSYDQSKLKKGQSPTLVIGLNIGYDHPVSVQEDEADMKPIESVCHSDLNEIEIRGQILAIQCNKNNDVTLTIRTILGGRWSIIDYPYYARNTNQFLRNIYVHQYVRAIGTIQTANVPVDSSEEEAAEDSARGAIRQNNIARPRIRTRKKQYYILYDVYAVDQKK